MHKLTWPKASFQGIYSYLTAESKCLVSRGNGKGVRGIEEFLLSFPLICMSQMIHIAGLPKPVDWADQCWPTTSKLTAAQLYFLSACRTERTLRNSCLIFTAIQWQYSVQCCFPFTEAHLLVFYLFFTHTSLHGLHYNFMFFSIEITLLQY